LTQTDSTRAKSLELHIQSRVTEELERLRQREQQTLEEIEKRLAAELPNRSTGAASSTASFSYAAPAGSLNLDAPRIPFAGREFDAPSFLVEIPAQSSPAPESSPQAPAIVDASRESVLKEIERLRSKLESRKKLTALDENVERAKSEVVNCLRLHDRRPLDCWKEVEGFKQEVAKLEQAFVDKVVG
jgi:altered-inheritance-of-mitochondria protein 13